MSFYDDIKTKPLSKRKCPQCEGEQKIAFKKHPIYCFICPKDHCYKIDVSVLDDRQKENKI